MHEGGEREQFDIIGTTRYRILSPGKTIAVPGEFHTQLYQNSSSNVVTPVHYITSYCGNNALAALPSQPPTTLYTIPLPSVTVDSTVVPISTSKKKNCQIILQTIHSNPEIFFTNPLLEKYCNNW